MADLISFIWGVGAFGTVAGVIGSVLFINGVLSITSDKETRSALTNMLFTSILAIINTSMVIIFWFMKISITNNLWIFFSVIYITLAISWTFGSYKLVKMLKGGLRE